MKVGPYCGYSLDEIIKIKQKEDKKNVKINYIAELVEPYSIHIK